MNKGTFSNILPILLKILWVAQRTENKIKDFYKEITLF